MTPYELAKAEIGTVEWAQGSNPKVVAYYRDAGHSEVKDDDVAWCAAFVGAMLKRGGQLGTGALNARSYLKWGKAVAIEDALPGDVCVIERGGSTWQGHVFFYVSQTKTHINGLGGNQRDAVSIAAHPKPKLLGVRRSVYTDAPVVMRPVTPKPVAAHKSPNVSNKPSIWATIIRAIVAIFKRNSP